MGSHTSAKSIRLREGNKQEGVWAAARQRVGWADSAHKVEDKKIWRFGGVLAGKVCYAVSSGTQHGEGSFSVKQEKKPES